MTTAEPDQSAWAYGGRFYATAAASIVSGDRRDGFALELEDIAPAPGRGLVLEAFWSDETNDFTFTAFTAEALPFDLVERFVREARQQVPPTTTD